MRLAKLASIFPVLLLAACYGPPPPQPVELPRAGGWHDGVDLATNSSEVVDQIALGRVDFVARYYRDPDSSWPALSAGEAQLLSLRGLKIIAVWESHSTDPGHFSYASGFGDAMTAAGEARAIGQPAGSAIYFAVDFNAHSWDLAPVGDYFRGVAAGIAAAASGGQPYYAIGVYGSGAVCEAVKGEGLARYSWLSNSIAWDGSGSYDNWDILQGEESAELGYDQDSDQARGEYGAFQVAGTGIATGGAPSRAPLSRAPLAPPAPQPPAAGQLMSEGTPPR